MKVDKKARAGTLESGDLFVTIEPSEKLEISLESPVKDQYGDAILQTVRELLDQWGVESGRITLADQGALDCTIRARLTTALRRAGSQGDKS
ncbi:MAG: citrate lyase acyl carrier protein [Clostridiaceae bacterium]|jgi:citrate lyase subunit gamma (acyl carrier protein)|nr:citrate lyase acyl carrier protein [Clostridiaceae bacterium]